MKFLKPFVLYLLLIGILSSNNAIAQCTWQTQLTEGFEYTTACPDVLPGVVYTSIPQSYSIHSGTKSLYLNFVNCAGGVGTCAGDTVYIRTIAVCPNINYRISSFFTTTFSGSQSDINLVIVNENDSVLVNTASVLAPYSPTWINYQSGSFTPSTATIKFIMITNIDGQNGNDLSMDDFLMENCFYYNIGADTTVCVNQTVTLDAGNGFNSYLWSNGFTTQTIVVAHTGGSASSASYSVVASDTNACQFSDTIKVSFIPCTLVPQINKDTEVEVFYNYESKQLTIISKGQIKPDFVILSDAAGKEIKRENITTKRSTIILNEFSNGLYFYHIQSDANVLKSGKFYIR